jgi:hypothetical protein
MNTLEHFEIAGKRGFYRPEGKVNYDLAVEMVATAMKHARTLGLESLLVNTDGLTGISPPSIFGRHALAVRWAEAAGASLHVAVVARPELVDPEKIGVVMAQNRGVSGDVFATEPAALAWLDARHRNTGQ